MKTKLIALSFAVLLGSLSYQASAATVPAFDSPDARAERSERVEKPQKPEKKEKVGATESRFQLAREAGERPRGSDNGRRGGRHA